MIISWNNVLTSLEITGKGMLGIFVTVIVIMCVVFLLSRSGSPPKESE